MIGTETVTILRPSAPGTDPYGDPLPSTTTRIDVPDCLVAPRTSTEPTERGREGIVIGWQIIAPAGTDARYTDGIEIRGVTCKVEGEIADWGPPGVVINATRAVG